MDARWQAVIDEVKAKTSSHQKRDVYEAQPGDFWLALLDEYVSPNGIKRETGITPEITYRYLTRFGIAWDSTRGKPLEQKRVEHWLESLSADIDGLLEVYSTPRLPADKTWLIISDLHIPTVSPLWLRRALAVAESLECNAVAAMGDFGNYDAISRFAQKDRGVMPRLQAEVDVLRNVVSLFEDLFAGNAYYLLTNHEARMIGALKHELDADDLFESLLRGGKWVESRLVDIGEVRFIHPDRGRKVLSSQANEFSMRYERPVFIAHSHRFFFGYSNSGRPIGMLGGLFDKTRIRYYMKDASYLEWSNGFFVLKAGRMLPFADGFVDWGEYGTE